MSPVESITPSLRAGREILGLPPLPALLGGGATRQAICGELPAAVSAPATGAPTDVWTVPYGFRKYRLCASSAQSALTPSAWLKVTLSEGYTFMRWPDPAVQADV